MSTDSTKDREDGFLNRWSNRKSEAGENTGDSTDNDEQTSIEAEVETTPVELEPKAAKILTDDDMPAIDSLHEGSDFSGFMSEGVSAALRKAALKRLFSQSVFNVRDGLNDYDDDYTSFAPLGDTVTVEMSYRAEVDAKREALKKALLQEEEESRADNPPFEDKDDDAVVEQERDLPEEFPELIDEQESPNDPSNK